MNATRTKIMFVSFILCLIIIFSSYLFLDFVSKKTVESNINSFLLNETVALQEGNILEVVSKSRRYINAAELIVALRVSTVSSGKLRILDEIGTVTWNDEMPTVDDFKTTGFLTYLISKEIKNGEKKIYFQFVASPRSLKIVYLVSMILVIFITLLFATCVYLISKREALTRVSMLKRSIESLIHGHDEDRSILFEFPELTQHWNEFTEKIKEYANAESYFKIASQVSHDIRSPLSALEMILPTLSEVSEEKRFLVKNSVSRIKDIANSLLLNTKNRQGSDIAEEGLNIICLLSPIIENLITEKRLEFRDRLGISIEYNQSIHNYGLFSNINSAEFKRVLSNIINNSVEAIESKHSGKVEVFLRAIDSTNSLIIKDSGKGIPENVLNHIGERGFTAGKSGGSGLGLYHAFELIKSWNGKINFTSKVNEGTTVEIMLPKQPAPDWFVPALKIKTQSTIVVIDDDQSIHQIWKERFSNIDVKMFHLSSPTDARKFYGAHFADIDECLFLVDYEFLGHKENGLDIIAELGIQKNSILVTSRYEEQHLRENANRQRVQIIPKQMSGFVPINVILGETEPRSPE